MNFLFIKESFKKIDHVLMFSISVFAGMLTITDFINILHRYYRSPMVILKKILDEHKNVYADCHHSSALNDEYLLYESQGSMIPKPPFLQKRIEEVKIGTFKSIATVRETETVYDALSVFVERRVSALPVVNEQGKVVALYSRFDVINLAAQKNYNNLNMTMQEAIQSRPCCIEGVLKCYPHETLETIIDRIAEAEVHRLVLVDTEDVVRGIVSLSDLLQALVLTPAGVEALFS
uniref:Protein kinase, AMP-activated, gamma 3b non-catalytic subunit n=1 Tax=Cyprinus carpio TaxID=7962 RepID=A0A8C2KQ36_CYPCA